MSAADRRVRSARPCVIRVLELPRAAGEALRARWAVRVWEERGDVRDGGQQQRAGQGALILRQRDDHVVLVPHVEGVVGERVGRRVTENQAVLGVGFCALFFIASWTQQTV